MSPKINVLNNIQQIARELKTGGADAVQLVYQGQNDDGEGIDYHVLWSPGTALLVTDEEDALAKVTYETILSDYKDGKHSSYLAEREAALIDAVHAICWQALKEIGLSNWAHDNGGKGTFTVYANGRAKIEHQVLVVKEVSKNITLAATSLEWQNTQSIAAILRTIGAPKVKAFYTYADDSYALLADMDLGTSGLNEKAKNCKIGFVHNKEKGFLQQLPMADALSQIIWNIIHDGSIEPVNNARSRHCILTVNANGEANLHYTDFINGFEPVRTYDLVQLSPSNSSMTSNVPVATDYSPG